jgi:hypothetical protein
MVYGFGMASSWYGQCSPPSRPSLARSGPCAGPAYRARSAVFGMGWAAITLFAVFAVNLITLTADVEAGSVCTKA